MAIVSVQTNALIKTRKLCNSAEKELKETISTLGKIITAATNEWSDKKSKEFESVVSQCMNALKMPLEELHRCDAFLEQLRGAIEEYEGIHFGSSGTSFSSGGSMMTNVSSSEGTRITNSSALDLHACDDALSRDGRQMQMVDISSIPVEGVDEYFWSHHSRSEEEWRNGMSEYENMMRSYSSGMSIDRCYDTYPHAAAMFFGRDPIRLCNVNGSVEVENGRHRIAMAQRMGITHLPAIIS